MRTTLTRRQFLSAATALSFAGVSPWVPPAAAAPVYQIGCYTRPWDQFEYRVALDGVAEAGFQYAGLMTAKGKSWVLVNVESTPEEVAVIAEEVRQRGLKVLSIYGGDFPVAKSVRAGIAGLKTLIDHCAICSCPNLLLGGTGEEKLVKAYYEVVAECCDYAADHGVGLSIKPHGGRNATGPQCRELIEGVRHPNFRLWYDPGNIFYYSDGKLDPIDDATTVNGLVAGMSVKDFLPPKEVMVTPGQGRVNFREVLARLQRGGFMAGPLIVECLARAETAGAITQEAKKARALIEGLVG